MQMKEIWIDCECTGTDPKKHALIQLSGEIVIDGITKAEFEFLMNPGLKELDKEALEVIQKTPEQLVQYPDQALAYKEFHAGISKFVNRYNKMDKFHWYGYNAKFDMDFVREWFIQNGDKYFGAFFWNPPIDVWMLAGFALRRHRHELENTKLWTVAKWLGIDVEKYKAHDAKDDIAVTKELYGKVVEHMGLPKNIE